MTWLSLALRNLVFTVVVPGAGGGYVPWLILRRHGTWPPPVAWYATGVIAVGALLYLACVWVFATQGRGTPGLWDSPRRVVTIGPYRWVRNPIYLAALLIVSGCADKLLSDDRIRDNTALALHVPASSIVIGDRRYDGMTNTYYVARTSRGTYSCVINGGSVMAMGMANPPQCSRL